MLQNIGGYKQLSLPPRAFGETVPLPPPQVSAYGWFVLLVVTARVVSVGKSHRGDEIGGRSTSAQNKPFTCSVIPRNSVTRTWAPANTTRTGDNLSGALHVL